MKKYFSYFYLILVLALSSVYLFFLFRSFFIDGVLSYALGELMINYSCGFIRRGLLGSIFLWLSQISTIHIFDLYSYATLLAQLILFVWIAIRLYNLKLLNIFFLSSPVGILFIINNWGVFGFKDVYVLLYTLSILLILKKDFKYKNAFVFISILIGGLLHEPFLFFSAPFILLSLNANSRSEKSNPFNKINVTYFFSLLVVFIFLFITNSYNLQRISCLYEKANTTLKAFPNKDKIDIIDYKDPIRWIGEDLKYGINKSSKNYKEPYLLKWTSLHFFIILCSLILVCICIFNFSDILHCIVKYKLWLLYLFSSYLLIYFIALDWGRWLYLMVMNFIIYISVNKENITFNFNTRSSVNVLVTIILICCSLVYVPHFYSGAFPQNPYNTIFYRMFMRVTEYLL